MLDFSLTSIERIRISAAVADVFSLPNDPVRPRQKIRAALAELFGWANYEAIANALHIAARLNHHLAGSNVNWVVPDQLAKAAQTSLDVAMMAMKLNGGDGTTPNPENSIEIPPEIFDGK